MIAVALNSQLEKLGIALRRRNLDADCFSVGLAVCCPSMPAINQFIVLVDFNCGQYFKITAIPLRQRWIMINPWIQICAIYNFGNFSNFHFTLLFIYSHFFSNNHSPTPAKSHPTRSNSSSPRHARRRTSLMTQPPQISFVPVQAIQLPSCRQFRLVNRYEYAASVQANL